MKAVRTQDLEGAYWSDDANALLPERGEFELKTVAANGQRQFLFICPGCQTLAVLAIRPVVDGSPQSWELTGDTNAPTLHPSINHQGCWHGWLKDGEFTSC